jgi:GntR family transcriptional regulator
MNVRAPLDSAEGGPLEGQSFEPLIRGTPLPIQIARAITERIHSGDLPPGSKVPSEPALAAQFGVSRATIREATRLLVGEQLLQAHRGRGTFVCYEPHLWPVDTGLEELVSMTDLIKRAGYKASTQLLERRLADPPAEVIKALGVDAGTQVGMLRRIRLADGTPVAYSLDYVKEDLYRLGAIECMDEASSLLVALERATGKRITGAVTRIEPISATRELVTALAVTRQQNLLLLRETYYLEHQDAVLYSENRINSELLSFYVRRTPPSQTLGPLSDERKT